MSEWQKLLRDLRSHLHQHLAGRDYELALKLANGIESEFLRELIRDPQPAETGNFVAMTPKIIRLVDLPTPACSHCGAFMKVTHSGDGVYVVDHCGTPNDCPEAFKMWKVRANTIGFSEQILVPPFVRDAMGKNS